MFQISLRYEGFKILIVLGFYLNKIMITKDMSDERISICKGLIANKTNYFTVIWFSKERQITACTF